MRIIIAGCRTSSKADLNRALSMCEWIGFASAIVSGTAKGADQYGEEWAKDHSIMIHRFSADWGKFGKKAGPLRNNSMANNAEGLVAVWDGQSRGTKSMIELAIKYGLNIHIYRTDNDTTESHEPTGKISHLWETIVEKAALLEFGSGYSRDKAEREAIRVLGIKVDTHLI